MVFNEWGLTVSELKSTLAEDFSLTRGGPLYRLQVLLGQAHEDRARVIHRAVGAILLTWAPLLILSLLQGAAYGTKVRIPLLRDYAVNVRFLVALPIFILAESNIDRGWRTLVGQFLKSGLVQAPELPAFEDVLRRITRLRDSVLPEALMLLAAYVPYFFVSPEALISHTSNWNSFASGSTQVVTLAGRWLSIVSFPTFRFLLYRWAWRMCLWALFLYRVSRINLRVVATHADHAAGLGFLSAGQRRFSSIVFAGGAVVSAGVTNAIVYEGATLAGMRAILIAYGVLATLLLVAPLLAVTPLLLKTKRSAILQYGALVTSHNQDFAAKWIEGSVPHDESILGNPDASSLIDLGSSLEVVQQMKPIPVAKSTLTSLAVAAALPMVPMLLVVTPADQLLRAVMKMLM